MTKHFSLSLSLTMLMLGSACAVGPLVSHETARTVGKHNHELVGAYGNMGYAAKWSFGVSEDIDLGLQWEMYSIGLRGKYSFINNQAGGWSAAAALGAGSSTGGSHYYGDLLGSYLVGKWEPYSTLRLVHVVNDGTSVNTSLTEDGKFVVPTHSYNYGQFMLGTRFWLDQNWLLALEASTMFSLSSDFEFSDGLVFSGAFGYRF